MAPEARELSYYSTVSFVVVSRGPIPTQLASATKMSELSEQTDKTLQQQFYLQFQASRTSLRLVHLLSVPPS